MNANFCFYACCSARFESAIYFFTSSKKAMYLSTTFTLLVYNVEFTYIYVYFEFFKEIELLCLKIFQFSMTIIPTNRNICYARVYLNTKLFPRIWFENSVVISVSKLKNESLKLTWRKSCKDLEINNLSRDLVQ